MLKGSIKNIKNINNCKNLLFFSQLVAELLYDYSIPSNRISTLNSHYLCIDAKSAIQSIEKKGVPEGTLKPIMEELYETIKKDPVLQEEDNPLRYFVKYQNDQYKICSKVSDMVYEDLKRTAYAIDDRFFKNNIYFEALKKQVINLVEGNKEEEQPKLLRCVRSLITELVNSGYSVRYICHIMNDLFWNSKEEIVSPTIIRDFFKLFDFNEIEFKVVFVVNKEEVENFANHTDKFELIETLDVCIDNEDEKKFIKEDVKFAYLQKKIKDFDPYSAADSIKLGLEIELSFYRLCDHLYNFDVNSAECGVYSDKDFYIIEPEVSGVAHKKSPTIKQVKENRIIADKAIDSVKDSDTLVDLISIIQAVRFHAHSLDATASENQLLDLWAIFESVLDISNKHTSDRINQICKYVIPILKRKYIYSLFLQLSEDMKEFSRVLYEEIVGNEKTEEEIVTKICEFVILKENEEKRQTYIEKCENGPLLKERILYYNQNLSTTGNMFNFVEKHGKTVKWQIMRIYRNRNLIIHNARSMPYLNLLIENLHSYVDDFLNYIIHSFAEGYNVNSMCQNIFAEECEWINEFSRNSKVITAAEINKVLKI